ncbi:MAG: amidohydrolase family protein, partial [Gemmatimonas sp.]|nr:amidohydrolase family protein [Gemmatimonas sp.]
VDLVLHNGRVAVIDEAFTIHSAIAIDDGRVVAVGGDEIVSQYTGTEVFDLRGRLVVPGFNDTHIHLSGQPNHQLDLAGMGSVQELKEAVAAKAGEVGPGNWVTGVAWSEDDFVEQRRPLRADLDEAAPDNPVVLTRAGSHSSVANTLALELGGIDRNTPDPTGGIIEKGPDGEPNGILREQAMGLVRRHVPQTSPEELRESLVERTRNLLSLGITSFILAGATPDQFEEWETIYAEYGDELPRATIQIRGDDLESLQSFGKKTGDGDERLRVGAVKLVVDGGYTGAAAYTLEPYVGQPGFFGQLLIPEDELFRLLRGAHEMGWQVGIHAIGDAAIQLTVDVLDRILTELPRSDHRHYLTHFTVMPPDETLDKIVRHDILVAQQPNFVYTLEGRYVEHLDGRRLELNNAVGTLQQRGIFVALGADVLPIDPRVGLYSAVTRKGRSGRVFGEEDRITMQEAIRGYSANGAHLTWEEDTKGTLEEGMLADLVVLGEDLLTIDPERILEVPVDMTVVNGRIVYERD